MTPAGGEGGGVLAPATVDRRLGLLYVGTGSSYGTPVGCAPGTCSLVALHLQSGKRAWRDQVYPGDTHGFDFNSAPVLVGPRLLVLANKDGFRAWDRLTRRRLWHRRLTRSTDSTGAAGPTTGPEGGPVATDGRRIYVLSNDNDSGTCVAAALAPWTGEPLWHHRLPSFSFTACAVGGDRMFARAAPTACCGCSTPPPAGTSRTSRWAIPVPRRRRSCRARSWSERAPRRSCPASGWSAWAAEPPGS